MEQPSNGFKPSHSTEPMFYGWKVAWGILVVLTFTSGLSFYNHAVILDALATQPNFSVQSASIAVSIFFLSGGLTGLAVAKALNHYDIRISITFGSVVSALALIGLAFVHDTTQLYVVYAVFGVGFSASSLIPATTLISRWFRRRRAMALSISSTGLSLGGVIVTPICAFLVERIGLAKASPIMAAMYLLGTLPVTWLVLRPTPQSMGLTMDGVVEANPNSSEQQALSTATSMHLSDGISFANAIRTHFFWGMALAYIFLMMAQVGGIAHQVGMAKESLTESQVVFALAILPVASIVGRLIGGWMVEQLSIRGFSIAMMALQVVALCVLAFVKGAVGLCLGLALFGATVGNLLMLQPLLVAEAFGLRDYPRIYAIVNLMSSWGTAAGPALLGLAYAMSQQTYSMAYAVAAASGCLGLLLFISGGSLAQLHRSQAAASA